MDLTPGPFPTGKGRHDGGQPPLLLTADWVVPITAPPLRDGAVLIVGERIRAVGPRRSIETPPNTAHRHYDGAAILPGLVNLHTHLEYTGLGPLSERQPFWEWMPALIRRSQQAPADFWPASASAGAERLVAAGMTCVGDIVTFGPGLAAAQTFNLAGISFVEAVGMRERERLDEQLAALAARLDQSVRTQCGSRQPKLPPGRGGCASASVRTPSIRCPRRRSNGWPIWPMLASSHSQSTWPKPPPRWSFRTPGRGCLPSAWQ